MASPETESSPLFRPAGDSAVIIEFGNRLSESISNAVLAFDARLRSFSFPEIVETAPAIRSVFVRFDPLISPPAAMRDKLGELLAERNWLEAPPPDNRRLWRLPAHYGGEAGPDLAEVADLTGMSEDGSIQDHASTRQRVLMLGFAPGFAYLGGLSKAWAIPRLSYVKPKVPPGSISVAVRQTTFSATTIPTGWRTIARTPFLSFDLKNDPPFLLEPGDEITFDPVSEADFAKLAAKTAEGLPIVQPEAIT
ncbi:allophanate hydrolase subunit 1 [Pelagibius sp. Alg239-R121]|uniref:5-oxoprolinase subunit B family protein n=1 Tax=Pelagibius sp. Alg239-R121 TaxID=2993448 RepID=UPI0024A740FB|nr:allophanate hydrolase subunit 1 [Pelagibius sp. Alg239-R121]